MWQPATLPTTQKLMLEALIFSVLFFANTDRHTQRHCLTPVAHAHGSDEYCVMTRTIRSMENYVISLVYQILHLITRTIIVQTLRFQPGLHVTTSHIAYTTQKWMLKRVLWWFYCCSHLVCSVICGTSSHNWPVSSKSSCKSKVRCKMSSKRYFKLHWITEFSFKKLNTPRRKDNISKMCNKLVEKPTHSLLLKFWPMLWLRLLKLN